MPQPRGGEGGWFGSSLEPFFLCFGLFVAANFPSFLGRVVVVGFVSLFVVMGVLLGDFLETLGSILPTLGSILVTLGALLVTFWAPGVHLEPQGARGEKSRYFWRSSPHVWVQLGTPFLFFCCVLEWFSQVFF